ncbi:hypothetical protein HYU92_06030 [Candidatus Curtissbacteria bacterium]|nr:hypothetical protein [Candidatus Curtissbacteria bacterium]
MNQIRLQKTPEIEKVLAYLRSKYNVLSEAEILKLALSEKYYREISSVETEQQLRKLYRDLKSEGKKLGDKLLAKKGLKRKNVSEAEFYSKVIEPDNA